ncbi:MAG: hypothetical protein Q8873_04120 [Bacillota bacterium]|nr:hypothetical protein [Bacillota bacterium]
MSDYIKKVIHPKDENIITLKVFDQCKIQKCIEQGPAISAEKCNCIIIEDCGNDFGRVIVHGRPIYLPETVRKVKLVKDSFMIKSIVISDLTPSQVKNGYWDADVEFLFEFKLNLFDCNMNLLKILCYSEDCKCIESCREFKDNIRCSVSYIINFSLFGSKADSPIIVSDLFLQAEHIHENIPHLLLESKAYPLDVEIKKSIDECLCPLDNIYDEPTRFIYINIGLFAIVKLFRIVGLLVESKGYDIPEKCNLAEDPCCLFNEMDMPEDITST